MDKQQAWDILKEIMKKLSVGGTIEQQKAAILQIEKATSVIDNFVKNSTTDRTSSNERE